MTNAPTVGGLWYEFDFDWGPTDQPGAQKDTTIESDFRLRGPVDNQWGRSESLDPDNVGDIADEGAGHRG